MQINVQDLTNTITVAVMQAVKDVLVSQRSSRNSQGSSQTAPTAPQVIERAMDDEAIALTEAGTNRASVLPLFEAGDQPRQLFSSIAVNLGARVNDEVKAKDWANEYIDFGVHRRRLQILTSGSLPLIHSYQSTRRKHLTTPQNS